MSKDSDAVKKGKLPFFRGGAGPLRSGPAYFISSEMMAKFYGPVTEYRLKLKKPKFVDQDGWGRFDATVLRFDSSAVDELRADGYDSAVWATDTPKGRMYTVFTLDGLKVAKEKNPRRFPAHIGPRAVELAHEVFAVQYGVHGHDDEIQPLAWLPHWNKQFPKAYWFRLQDTDYDRQAKAYSLATTWYLDDAGKKQTVPRLQSHWHGPYKTAALAKAAVKKIAGDFTHRFRRHGKRRTMQRTKQPKKNPSQVYFVQLLEEADWHKVKFSDIAVADSRADAARDVHLRFFGVPPRPNDMFAVTPVRAPGRGLVWIPEGDTVVLVTTSTGSGTDILPAGGVSRSVVRRFESMIGAPVRRRRRSMQRKKQPKKNPRATIAKYLKGL